MKNDAKINSVIIVMIVVAMSFLVIAIANDRMSSKSVENPTITLTIDNLTKIKEDAYTMGFIDGRGSRLEEESIVVDDSYNITYGYITCPRGVPKSNEPNRYNRDYTDKLIASQNEHMVECKDPKYLAEFQHHSEFTWTSIREGAVITGITWYDIRNGTGGERP